MPFPDRAPAGHGAPASCSPASHSAPARPAAPIRPLVLAGQYPKLSETYIHDEVRLLLRRGLRPRVLPLLADGPPEAFPGEEARRATECSLGCPAGRAPDGRHLQDLPSWAAELLQATQ